jgi:hypothetical protein
MPHSVANITTSLPERRRSKHSSGKHMVRSKLTKERGELRLLVESTLLPLGQVYGLGEENTRTFGNAEDESYEHVESDDDEPIDLNPEPALDEEWEQLDGNIRSIKSYAAGETIAPLNEHMKHLTVIYDKTDDFAIVDDHEIAHLDDYFLPSRPTLSQVPRHSHQASYGNIEIHIPVFRRQGEQNHSPLAPDDDGSTMPPTEFSGSNLAHRLSAMSARMQNTQRELSAAGVRDHRGTKKEDSFVPLENHFHLPPLEKRVFGLPTACSSTGHKTVHGNTQTDEAQSDIDDSVR